MPRSIWTGTISFGLVNVPVEAHTAVRDHDVHFHQLDKRSGSRIRNRKVSEETGREVKSGDIQLGFEISKGRYVTFDSEELDKLRPRSTRTIEVTDFVALEDIDPIYYERTYWLAPHGDGAKQPYQLLLAAMEDRQRAAIGTVVIRNKQYLAAIRPLDDVLAMSTMRFADEVVPRSDVDIPVVRAKPDARAMRIATQLVDALESEWEPKRYHDTYAEELRRRIKAKNAGKEIVETEEEEEAGGKVIDMMKALEDSLRSAKQARATGKAPAKKARARKPPAKKSVAKKPAAKKSSARKAPAARRKHAS